MMNDQKNKVGRPKGKEATKSYTVSLLPSEKDSLVKSYGSLTLAIKQLLNQKK